MATAAPAAPAPRRCSPRASAGALAIAASAAAVATVKTSFFIIYPFLKWPPRKGGWVVRIFAVGIRPDSLWEADGWLCAGHHTARAGARGQGAERDHHQAAALSDDVSSEICGRARVARLPAPRLRAPSGTDRGR